MRFLSKMWAQNPTKAIYIYIGICICICVCDVPALLFQAFDVDKTKRATAANVSARTFFTHVFPLGGIPTSSSGVSMLKTILTTLTPPYSPNAPRSLGPSVKKGSSQKVWHTNPTLWQMNPHFDAKDDTILTEMVAILFFLEIVSASASVV